MYLLFKYNGNTHTHDRKKRQAMRLCLLIICFTGLSVSGFAQPPESTQRTGRAKPVVYSASSNWQKVTFKPTPRLRPAQPPSSIPTTNLSSGSVSQPDAVAAPTKRPALSASNPTGYRPAFAADFVTNRNGWKSGNKGDYQYQIALGKYNIRKRNVSTNQTAFSYIPLPTDINLNIAETFTIKVDVVADSNRIPTGGILFGVADSLNYCAFSLNSNGEVSIVRVVNGATFGDYMPGDYFKSGVLIEKNRDRLTIRRNDEALHFYVNDREVRSSPYLFRMLSGNGIGLTTTGYWTSFQKLLVTLGP